MQGTITELGSCDLGTGCDAAGCEAPATRIFGSVPEAWNAYCADHAECKHGIELNQPCSYCLGNETTRVEVVKVVKPTDWFPKRKAPKDPAVVLAEAIADGLVCSVCSTPHAPIGCQCQREARYELLNSQTDGAQAWVGDNADVLSDLGIDPGHLAAGAVRRTGRRAGLADRHPGPTEPNQPGDLAEDMRAARDHFGHDPLKAKWHRPRTVEADYLPV